MKNTKRTGQDEVAAPTLSNGQRTTASERGNLRRCRTREEGLALVALGHAIEYLIDSQLARPQEPSGEAQREALTILMEANRNVYQQGTAIRQSVELARPWGRFWRWLSRGDAAESQAQGAALFH
jgi:hypothetical protein